MKLDSFRWVAAATLVLAAGPAWAYIDPGTGSMLVQSALAIIAMALVAGRSTWQMVKNQVKNRVKSLFSRRRDDAADRKV